jgi:hypothetical protein
MLSEEDLKRIRDEQDQRDEEFRKNMKMPENLFWQTVWRFLNWKS